MLSYILIPTPASYPESRDLAKKIGVGEIGFLDAPLCWGTASPSIPLLMYGSTNIHALHTLQTIVLFYGQVYFQSKIN